MPNARDNDRLRDAYFNLDFAPDQPAYPRLKRHEAVLQFNAANQIGNTPIHPFFRDSSGRLKGLWLLDGEDLSVVSRRFFMNPNQSRWHEERGRPHRGGVEENVSEGGGAADADPEEEEETLMLRGEHHRRDDRPHKGPEANDAYRRVCPLRSWDGRQAYVNRALLEDTIDRRYQNDLVGRFKIIGGDLSTANVSADRATREFLTFDFGNNAHHDSSPQATVLVWEKKIYAPRVRFRAEKFSGISLEGGPARESRFLELQPDCRQPRNGEHYVEVWLINREFDEIITQRRPPVNERDRFGQITQEFYLLSQVMDPCSRPALTPSGIRRLRITEEPSPLALPIDDAMARAYFLYHSGENSDPPDCTPVEVSNGSSG